MLQTPPPNMYQSPELTSDFLNLTCWKSRNSQSCKPLDQIRYLKKLESLIYLQSLYVAIMHSVCLSVCLSIHPRKISSNYSQPLLNIMNLIWYNSLTVMCVMCDHFTDLLDTYILMQKLHLSLHINIGGFAFEQNMEVGS